MFKKFTLVLGISLSILSFLFSFSHQKSFQSNTFVYPTTITYTSSNFGYRELFGKTNYHDGIDFPVAQGNPVYACFSGTVIFADFTKNGYGNAIILLHDNGFKSLYGHLSETFISHVGEYVRKGEIIGFVGPKVLSNGKLNGNTTGPHLHFSIFDQGGKAIDPFSFTYEKRE